MDLTFQEELAWKKHVQELYLAARNYHVLAEQEDNRFREYLKGKYESQPKPFT